MKQLLLLLSAVSSLCLMAGDHEVDLLLSKQYTRGYSWLGISNAKVEPEKPTAFGLRYGYDLAGLGPAQFQLQLSYHAQSSASIPQFSYGTINTSNTINLYDLKNKGYSLGAQAQWRMAIQLGLGAELRYEKLDLGSFSTTQTRPWITARAGFSIPSPIIHPIVGLEIAVPLTNQGEPRTTFDPYGGHPVPEELLKRLSPKFEVTLFAGIRF